MLLLIFSFPLFWYYNFKTRYDSSIKAKVLDISQTTRDGKVIKITHNGSYFGIYCENEDILRIGDSISKEKKSDEFKVYRKSSEDKKWFYLTSIYFSKDLELYSLIVEKK